MVYFIWRIYDYVYATDDMGHAFMSDLYMLTGELPRHLYVHVDTTFTHYQPQTPRYQPAIWFGLVSHPGRAWGCTVLLESGAVYRALPPHALAFSPHPEGEWTVQQAQKWDCYGAGFSTLEYDMLRSLECLVRTGTEEIEGEYLFSLSPIGDAYSAAPDQAKEFTFIRLANSRLTIQPTDRIVFIDRSFTTKDVAFPRGLRRQTITYSCE